MIQIVRYPDRQGWKEILQRPVIDHTSLFPLVQGIMDKVREEGDSALFDFIAKYDKASINRLSVSEEEIIEAEKVISSNLKNAIDIAYQNIDSFHKTQLESGKIIETMPGVRCWRRSVAIEKVGLYIPGGTAPLFSTVLMLGIPAQIAGCKRIILCSPCDKDGKIHPAILYSAKKSGIREIYKVGGAQAIAAMAYGTKSIPQVYKIFGPGNQYVTTAKQIVQMNGVAIDMPAGPSEVCVIADDAANASFIAADLLSQAEHGVDSHVVLVTTSEQLIKSVQSELEKQLNKLDRKEIAAKALGSSKIILVKNIEDAIDLVNEYGPEHLILSCKNAEATGDKVLNAGSVFIGNFSPESAGDYASGTNHTLPTNGFAKAFSGVSVDSFVKKITYQQLTQEGLNNIAKTVIQMAEAEGLTAHANAIRIRLEK